MTALCSVVNGSADCSNTTSERPHEFFDYTLLRVLGTERWANLVLFVVLAHVAAQGSYLSAVRWATQHAVAETLGRQAWDEDDLSAALDRLAEEPDHIRHYRI
jgi:hypothetical protein